MYVMKLPKSWEKNKTKQNKIKQKKTSKGLEETVPSTHIGLGVVSISTSQTRKPIICEALSWYLASIVGPNAEYCLSSPNKY